MGLKTMAQMDVFYWPGDLGKRIVRQMNLDSIHCMNDDKIIFVV